MGDTNRCVGSLDKSWLHVIKYNRICWCSDILCTCDRYCCTMTCIYVWWHVYMCTHDNDVDRRCEWYVCIHVNICKRIFVYWYTCTHVYTSWQHWIWYCSAMFKCMHACKYMYKYSWILIYMCICVHIMSTLDLLFQRDVCMHAYTCVYARIHVYMYIHIYVFASWRRCIWCYNTMFESMLVCVCTCIRIHMYTYKYMYTYSHIYVYM